MDNFRMCFNNMPPLGFPECASQVVKQYLNLIEVFLITWLKKIAYKIQILKSGNELLDSVTGKLFTSTPHLVGSINNHLTKFYINKKHKHILPITLSVEARKPSMEGKFNFEQELELGGLLSPSKWPENRTNLSSCVVNRCVKMFCCRRQQGLFRNPLLIDASGVVPRLQLLSNQSRINPYKPLLSFE